MGTALAIETLKLSSAHRLGYQPTDSINILKRKEAAMSGFQTSKIG